MKFDDNEIRLFSADSLAKSDIKGYNRTGFFGRRLISHLFEVYFIVF